MKARVEVEITGVASAQAAIFLGENATEPTATAAVVAPFGGWASGSEAIYAAISGVLRVFKAGAVDLGVTIREVEILAETIQPRGEKGKDA